MKAPESQRDTTNDERRLVMLDSYSPPEFTVLGSVAELTLSGFPCVIFPKPGGHGTVTKTIGATDHVFHTVHGQPAPLTNCSI